MIEPIARRANFAARVCALGRASVRAIGFARRSGLGWKVIFRLAAKRLSEGPKPMVRRIMALAARAQAVEVHFEPQGKTGISPYEAWIEEDSRLHPYVPSTTLALVSIAMPTCDTPSSFLQDVIESVRSQSYPHWELCIADDASTKAHVREMLTAYSKQDSRISVIYLAERGGISRATNAAIAMARGEIVTFLDHDDVLHVDAVGEIANRFAVNDVDVVYSDHDALGEDGHRRFPFFKPDFTLDLLLQQMYVGHIAAFSRDLLRRVGGLRTEFDGAQDYDLMLRCVVAGARIGHIPKILYHWRQHSESTASNADSKPYAHGAGLRAIQSFLNVYAPGARVEDGAHTFCYDVRYAFAAEAPLVSIIIPTLDGVDLLETCVASIRNGTDYPNYEIVIVDNGSVRPETIEWFDVREAEGAIRVINAPVPFNWSHLNNLAAAEARGDVLVFLNNDTEVISRDWLQRLCENALRPDVGVVGPLLLYPDLTIQHAGVVVGMGGWADHVFKAMQPVHSQVLFVSPILRRNVLAVTGACMAISRKVFDAIGGFDEHFIVCGSDVEICLRAFRSGFVNVYLPESQLIHHESKTRDPRAIPENDFVLSAEAYGPFRDGHDPYFSRNLDRMSPIPSFGVRT